MALSIKVLEARKCWQLIVPDAAATVKLKVFLTYELPIIASDIAEEKSIDTILSCIYQYVMDGWPQR